MGADQGRVNIITNRNIRWLVWEAVTPGLGSSLVKVGEADRISRKRGLRISGRTEYRWKNRIVDNMYAADYIIVATGAHEGEVLTDLI